MDRKSVNRNEELHPSRSEIEEVGDSVISEIVSKAEANDANYFSSRMDPHSRGWATNLISMVKQSGIQTNYVERLTLNEDGTGNLNYHYPERDCHFQVDLVKTSDAWIAKRFSFCR